MPVRLILASGVVLGTLLLTIPEAYPDQGRPSADEANENEKDRPSAPRGSAGCDPVERSDGTTRGSSADPSNALAERDCPDRSPSAAVQEGSPEEAFLIKAAEHQKKEMALGALAREQAESPDVRQFAEIMIRDHARAAGELHQLASREDIELPADSAPLQTDPESEYRLLDQAGGGFDRAYMEERVRDHRTHVSEFEQQARQLTDPEIRRWASATLPVLKEHLRIAQDVATNLEVDEAG